MPFSESDSVRHVRHNLELWLVGEEKLDLHALYDELHRRYPDMALRSPTNYAAHLLAAVMEYEAARDANPKSNDVRWELVEMFDGKEHVVGHYTDETGARRACSAALMAGAPTEPGDIWDESDYFVRRATDA